MAFLEKYSIHTRKKIALMCTGGVGLILIIVLFLVYANHNNVPKNDAGSQISHFYTTLLDNAQSYFGKK